MGLAGAAIATGLSQTAGLLIVGVRFVRPARRPAFFANLPLTAA